MQGDGNLVIYSPGRAQWASNTAGHPGSGLVVQDDGNTVIYDPGGHALWATNTWLPTGPRATGAQMRPGETLAPGQQIVSASGRYRFIYQGDGNLVLYDGGRATWASNTPGRPPGVCIMQGDGNLVIYTPGGHPIWASNTAGHNGSGLVVQDDGNTVIYDPAGHPVWATNTWLPNGPTATGSQMRPGETLSAGQQIVSASGRFRFVYQGDGNLVLYDVSHATWASNTAGKPAGVCIMQGDGNLVVYSPGRAQWASNTAGHGGSSLVVQNDGNTVIYDPGGHPLWATNTVAAAAAAATVPAQEQAVPAQEPAMPVHEATVPAQAQDDSRTVRT
jgi:outer membrane lipoprotein-sorting protein